MAELSFVDFRRFANNKLNILKEETSSQYAEYVMKNFGKLYESVSDEDLYHIAEYNELDKNNINILRNVQYCDNLYDYFIYDDRTCIGVNKEGKIIYIGDYLASNLNGGSIMESYIIQVDNDEFFNEFIGEPKPKDFKVSTRRFAMKYKDRNEAESDMKLLKSISPKNRIFKIIDVR